MTVKIVAEISGNHGGKLENCLRLIDEAKKLEVDCIKFQCFEPKALASNRAAGHLGKQFSIKSLYEVYSKTHTPSHWWHLIYKQLKSYPWSCSVFSLEDLAFMEEVGCPSYKIASFEATNLGLINAVAEARKPLVISFNESHNQEDVLNAIEVAERAESLTLLYATPYDKFDMMDAIDNIMRLGIETPPWVDIGLSDHSVAGHVDLVQKCVEAGLDDMVERHLCLPDVKTVDADFSDDPHQFAEYIKAVRSATAA